MGSPVIQNELRCSPYCDPFSVVQEHSNAHCEDCGKEWIVQDRRWIEKSN
jgi:hypothetical protein